MSRPSDKRLSADGAAALIRDGACVAITGAGGGLLEPDFILEGIERRFLATGHPRGLTIVHAQGIGDRDRRGLNRLAYEGLVRRVIGGHWTWSPRMQELARSEKIEAYALPGGVLSLLMRECGARRPGLFSQVGLGTFVDPRLQGGRMNASARDDLVEHVTIGGEPFLHYKPLTIDVAILRGSSADLHGNTSFEREPSNLDGYALALAAHAGGGIALVQVGQIAELQTRGPRDIVLPAPLVSGVVVCAGQPQSHRNQYDPALSGEARSHRILPIELPVGIRGVIARLAALEAFPGCVASFGFGIPDGVARILAHEAFDFLPSIDHGVFGGTSLDGDMFGFVENPDVIVNATDQIDFYHGGGIDIAFLGFGEIDARGNVNASMIGGVPVGPGGFMDIAHGARKLVFCGTFDAVGASLTFDEGRLSIERHGRLQKLVESVAQITFCAAEAQRVGKNVVYVTERAVFELADGGVWLKAIAAGVDLQRDVLDRMGFRPQLAERIETFVPSTV